MATRWQGRGAPKGDSEQSTPPVRRSRGGSEAGGRGRTTSAREAYQEQIKSIRNKVRARGESGSAPDWVIRVGMEWWLPADPGHSSRSNKMSDQDYEPVAMVVHRQPDPENPSEMVVGYPIQRTYIRKEGAKGFVGSNSWGGTRPSPEAPFPDLLDVAYAKLANRGADSAELNMLTPWPHYVLKCTLLDDFHEVEVKRPGQKSGYSQFTRCDGKDRNGRSLCPLCDSGNKASFGREVFWIVGQAQYEAIVDGVLALSQQCQSCGQGKVYTDILKCASCGFVLADNTSEDEDMHFTEEQETEAARSPVECPECEHIGLAEPVLSCLETVGYGKKAELRQGCDTPVRARDPWAQAFVVQCKKEGKSTVTSILEVGPADDFGMGEVTTPEEQREYTTERFYGIVDLKSQMRILSGIITEEDLPAELSELQKILEADYTAHRKRIEGVPEKSEFEPRGRKK